MVRLQAKLSDVIARTLDYYLANTNQWSQYRWYCGHIGLNTDDTVDTLVSIQMILWTLWTLWSQYKWQCGHGGLNTNDTWTHWSQYRWHCGHIGLNTDDIVDTEVSIQMTLWTHWSQYRWHCGLNSCDTVVSWCSSNRFLWEINVNNIINVRIKNFTSGTSKNRDLFTSRITSEHYKTLQLTPLQSREFEI